MGRKIRVGTDLFDEDAIAFVRKLKKKLKPTEAPNGGTIPGKAYVVQLSHQYHLDGAIGHVSSIFLDEHMGQYVMRQFDELEEERRGRKIRDPGVVDVEVGQERGDT